MSSAIDIVNKIVQIGKTLRDVAELVKDVHTKNLIADLNLSLADLKMQVAELQEENLDLQKRIRTLESADEVRSRLEIKDAAYWFIGSPPPGRPQGPYCTGCFDASEKLVILRELPTAFQDFGKYECPVCKQSYGKKEM